MSRMVDLAEIEEGYRRGHETRDDESEDPGVQTRAIKLTAYRLLNTILCFGFFTIKGICALNPDVNPLLSSMSDWTLGGFVTLIMWWIGYLEKARLPRWHWFFHQDLLECSITRLESITEGLKARFLPAEQVSETLQLSVLVRAQPPRLSGASAGQAWSSAIPTPNERPSLRFRGGKGSSASPARTYSVAGFRFKLEDLRESADDLPEPMSYIVNLAKRFVTAAGAITSNRELCDQLRENLLEILIVVLMTAKTSLGPSSDKAALPRDLKRSVEQFQCKLESILEEVEMVQCVVTSNRFRHKVAAFLLSRSHTSALKNYAAELEWARIEFDVSSRLSASARLFRLDFTQFLDSLPRAKYAAFDSERPDRPSTCFEGTRTQLLQTIFDWVVNPDVTIPRFFWLNGIAGVGKTTVASTIAKLARDAGILGAQFFFCRKGEADLRNPALVIPTIAHQLASFDFAFYDRISTALEADPEAPYAGLKRQLERLILNPLSDLKRDPNRVVVIILDAFDECEARGAQEILQLLIAAMPSLPFFLKIFVTSRPEPHIRSVLTPSTNLRMMAIHDIEESIVQADIRLYLRACLRRLPAERDLDLPLDWITDDEIELIVQSAGGLFLHAELSLRFLLDALDPRAQLNALLLILSSGRGHSTNPYAYLDDMYVEILRSLISPANTGEVIQTLQLVLGGIILLRDPLPVDALERLLLLRKNEASLVLPLLHAVVLPPSETDPCPHVYHPSFPDFLQDPGRCANERFVINPVVHETRMAFRCLELLNRQLHTAMRGNLDRSLLNGEVDDLESKIWAALSPELQYACRYWASHVGKGGGSITQVLEMFLQNCLLAWLEAMSWLGEARLCLTSLEAVTWWAARNNCSSLTRSLLNDSHRILQAHLPTIAQGAQHIARSILPFLPRNISFLSQYKQYSDPTVTLFGGDLEWPPCLMVLTSHTDDVNSVVFSPNGSRLASGSNDRTVRIWDATTGGRLDTLDGHSYQRSVGFSPDGSQLASASSDATVRVWDATTGVCLATRGDHSNIINSLAYSPDGTRLASGSTDHTIRIWDTATFVCVNVLQGHVYDVRSVAFSSDGTRLASGSHDHTVRVWDVIGGEPLASLEGHSNSVLTVIFSPADSRLASGSKDCTIRLWDVTTETCLGTLQGHTARINSLSFTPDGQRLASGSRDKTVRIWDPIKHTCLTTFHGHSSDVTSVSISPTSPRVASASKDKTIRIWDLSAAEQLPDRERHSDQVASVTFSSDATRLASGSRDNTVRIWDATTGECLTILQGHSGRVSCVAFSDDGSRVTSGSCDHTIRVWHPIEGNCLVVLRGHQSSVSTVAFSQGGSRLASGSDDRTIRIWNTTSGDCLASISGHSSTVISVAFSPDSSSIVSKSEEGAILTWDALKYLQSHRSGADHGGEDGPSIDDRLEVEAGRLLKRDTSGTKHLICLLPPSFDISAWCFVNSHSGQYRVALGCVDGTVVILDVSLP